jgi:hypothetical protein
MASMKNQDQDGTDAYYATMEARGGITALGKCTATLKTHIPELTHAEFLRKAAAAGCTPSELLRDLVCLVTHGDTFGELMAAQRRESLEAPGPQKGLMARLFRTAKGN